MLAKALSRGQLAEFTAREREKGEAPGGQAAHWLPGLGTGHFLPSQPGFSGS